MLGKWYKNCLRLSELLDVNGRHLGFTFLIDRMTEVLTPDIYRAHCYEYATTTFVIFAPNFVLLANAIMKNS